MNAFHCRFVICLSLVATCRATVLAAENKDKIEVRRLDASAGIPGWVAESLNFRVYHERDGELARKVAAAAEKSRSASYRKWFGKVIPDWSPRCDIFLHAGGSEYSQDTGLAAAMLPGFSTMEVDNGRVIRRRIDLNAGNGDLLVAILPHEVTHVVTWSWFGQRDFPQWVNEGMAVLSEPRDRVERHLRNLNRHRQRGELLTVSRLLRSQSYPERHLLGPFYAQSVSLVDFLTTTKDAGTFARFVRDGMRRGYDTASRRHYGWTIDELEERWWRYAFGTDEQETSE